MSSVAPRQTFEQYASRVVCLILAGLILWLITHGHNSAWSLYFWLLVFGKIVLTGIDFHQERAWWTLLIILLMGCLLSLVFLVHPEDLPREQRILVSLISASIIAEAGLLLLGRIRRVWAFCRVPQEPFPGRRR